MKEKKQKKFDLKKELLEINNLRDKKEFKNQDIDDLLEYFSKIQILSYSAYKTLIFRLNNENITYILKFLMENLDQNSTEEFKIQFLKLMKSIIKDTELNQVEEEIILKILDYYKKELEINPKSKSIHHLISYINELKDEFNQGEVMDEITRVIILF